MVDGTYNASDAKYITASVQNRNRLITTSFVPLLKRYGNNPHILAWDAINEPNWLMEQDHRLVSPIQDYIRKFTAAVHTYTDQLASVGLGYAKDRSWMKGLGLDYYTFHYYSWMSRYPDFDVFKHRASYWGMDKPIVIGEMDATVPNTYEALYSLGYSGAWGWSYNYNRTADKLQVDWPLFSAFASTHRSEWNDQPTRHASIPPGSPASGQNTTRLAM